MRKKSLLHIKITIFARGGAKPTTTQNKTNHQTNRQKPKTLVEPGNEGKNSEISQRILHLVMENSRSSSVVQGGDLTSSSSLPMPQ